MNKKALLFLIVALLLLVACGGDAEPTTTIDDNDTSSSTTTETTDDSDTESDSSDEEMEEEATDEEPAGEEEMEEEATAVEEEPEDAPAEEAPPASPFGDRPMSGTDPDTGLPVNPENVNPGDTFIVRGEIISMNLTPTTSPEFLIQSPAGDNFRLRSQDLADTFYEDGDQLQAFQYQLGILAQATATLAADASPSDIPITTDLVLVKDE